MIPEKIPFHTLSAEEARRRLETGREGLSQAQTEERLERYGPNELTAGKKISPLVIFLRQFANLLIIILLVATVLSLVLGDYLEAYVIVAFVLACVVLGFMQEYRSEKAAAALQKLAAPKAAVVREGR